MKTKRLLIGLLLSLSAASTHAATLTSAHEVEGAYPSTLLGTLNLETATQEELEQAFLTETDPESCAIRWKIAPTLIKRYGLTSLENIIKSVEKDFSMVDMDDMNIYRMSSAFGIAFAFKDLFDKNFNIWFDDSEKCNDLMNLIRLAPLLFSYQLSGPGASLPLHERLLERAKNGDAKAEEFAFELIEQTKLLTFCGPTSIASLHLNRFKNIESAELFPLINAEGKLFDFSIFDKLQRISLCMSEHFNPGRQTLGSLTVTPEALNEFIEKIPFSVDRISFSSINTFEDLSRAHTIALHMQRKREDFIARIRYSGSVNKDVLAEAKKTNPALFEWAASCLQSFCNAEFVRFKDDMPLFRNIETCNNVPLSALDNESYDFSVFGKLKSISFCHGDITQGAQNLMYVDEFVQHMPASVRYVDFTHINTHVNLVKAYNIWRRVQGNRPDIETQVHSFNVDILTKLHEVNLEALAWAQSYIESFPHISIVNNDGTLDLRSFPHMSGFKKLKWLNFSCNGSSTQPSISTQTRSYVEMIDLLPSSLQSISFYNLRSTLDWNELEAFLEALVTNKLQLEICLGEQK